MNFTQRAISLLAIAHLVLVAVGAGRLYPMLEGLPLGQSLQWWATMSGADSAYCFFAPGVGSEVRVRFLISDESGRTWEDGLAADHNQEVRLRVGSLIGLFPANPEMEQLRADLTACWSAAVFGRHPNAVRITVILEAFETPSMEGHRAGFRSYWLPVFEANYKLAPEADNVSGGHLP